MAYLDGVKVGDKLWLRTEKFEGWVMVTHISTDDTYPINIGVFGSFTMDGQLFIDCPQVLFWDKVEIVPPPRPKKMVKKVVEVRPIFTKYTQTQRLYNVEDTFDPHECNGPVQAVEIEVEE